MTHEEKKKSEVLNKIHNKLKGHDYIRELNDGYKSAVSDLALLENVGYLTNAQLENEKLILATVYLQSGLKLDE